LCSAANLLTRRMSPVALYGVPMDIEAFEQHTFVPAHIYRLNQKVFVLSGIIFAELFSHKNFPKIYGYRCGEYLLMSNAMAMHLQQNILTIHNGKLSVFHLLYVLHKRGLFDKKCFDMMFVKYKAFIERERPFMMKISSTMLTSLLQDIIEQFDPNHAIIFRWQLNLLMTQSIIQSDEYDRKSWNTYEPKKDALWSSVFKNYNFSCDIINFAPDMIHTLEQKLKSCHYELDIMNYQNFRELDNPLKRESNKVKRAPVYNIEFMQNIEELKIQPEKLKGFKCEMVKDDLGTTIALLNDMAFRVEASIYVQDVVTKNWWKLVPDTTGNFSLNTARELIGQDMESHKLQKLKYSPKPSKLAAAFQVRFVLLIVRLYFCDLRGLCVRSVSFRDAVLRDRFRLF
jgi:hypothetical protein